VNIAIDIRHLGTGMRGGIPEYTLGISRALVSLFPNDRFIFFAAGSKGKALASSLDFLDRNNARFVHIPLPTRALDPFLKYIRAPKLDMMLGNPDIIFSPHFLLTPSICPRLLVIHDLSFVRFPELFSWRGRLWHWFMDPLAQSKSASAIIAVSNATKSDLGAIWRIPEHKIHVVYSGIDDGIGREKTDMVALRQRVKLPPRFILALSVIEPRKNYAALLRAFEIVKARTASWRDISLVVAGPAGRGADSLMRAAQRSTVAGDVYFTGYIGAEDKITLLRSAEVFVYPSFFEGFGFPPLEAMASGVPVIVSDRASLPEVTQRAAVSVDPYNVTALASALERVIEDEPLRRRLRQEGSNCAARFTWSSAAQDVRRIMDEVVEMSRVRH